MSKKLLVIIVSLVVILGGLGGAYVWLSKGEAKEPAKPTTKVEKVDKNAEEKQKAILKIEAQKLVTQMNNVHAVQDEEEFNKLLNEVFYDPEKNRENYLKFYRPGDFKSVKVNFTESTVNLPNSDGLFSFITKYKTEVTSTDGKVYTLDESFTFDMVKGEDGKYKIVVIY